MGLLDNIVLRILNRICDFIVLNILWIICSIPIITIGASTCALYSIMLKIVKNEEGHIARGFLKAFKENFKQSTIVWLILLIVSILVALDFQAIKLLGLSNSLETTFRIILYVIIYIITSLILYAFPLLARYENTIWKTLKNALLLSIVKFPYTLAMLAIIIAAVFIAILDPKILAFSIVVFLFAGISLIAWVNSYLLRKAFEIFEN